MYSGYSMATVKQYFGGLPVLAQVDSVIVLLSMSQTRNPELSIPSPESVDD